MMNLKEFMAYAVAEQAKITAETYTIERRKSAQSWQVYCTLTATDGSAQADYGGTLVVINMQALIPMDNSANYTPMIGDRLSYGGNNYMAVNILASPTDAAWRVDLVQIQG